MDIISHSGTIISTDTEAGADKAMQIHSGLLMKLKLCKAAMGGLLWKLAVVWEFIKVRFRILTSKVSKVLIRHKR